MGRYARGRRIALRERHGEKTEGEAQQMGRRARVRGVASEQGEPRQGLPFRLAFGARVGVAYEEGVSACLDKFGETLTEHLVGGINFEQS